MNESGNFIVIGLGDMGCTALSSMLEHSVTDFKFVAVNNPANGLSELQNNVKIWKAEMLIFVAGIEYYAENGIIHNFIRSIHDNDILTLGLAFSSCSSQGEDNARAYLDALITFDNTDGAVQCVQCIANLLLTERGNNIFNAGIIIMYLADIRAVLSNAGTAVFGTGYAKGADRMRQAAKKAIQSTFIADSLKNFNKILINITAGSDATLAEMIPALKFLETLAAPDTNIIWNNVFAKEIRESVRVSIIAAKKDEQDRV